MEAGKLADRIRGWLGELPARQREVVLLRDLEGMSSEEVCAVLALTEGNQRVLLHRGPDSSSPYSSSGSCVTCSMAGPSAANSRAMAWSS